MDLRKLKTLIDLVSDSNVSELEITEAEGKVRIVKSGAEVAHQAYLPAMQMQMAAMQQQPVAAAPVAAAAPAAPAVVASEANAPAEPAGHTGKSPMVGTFYRASSPGAAPFVEVGSRCLSSNNTACCKQAACHTRAAVQVSIIFMPENHTPSATCLRSKRRSGENNHV